MAKTSKYLFLAVFAILLWPKPSQAFTARAGDSINLAKGEVIEGNLYVAGANLNIEGKVTGDVICAGQTVNISGRVSGNLRSVGSSINLTGQVNKNANLAAASINTSASSSVGWEMLFASAIADLRGRIGYDLTGAAETVNLAGSVGKDVLLRIDSQRNISGLNILADTTIGGKVNYTDKADAQIASTSKISGEVSRNPAKIKQVSKGQIFSHWLWFRIISLFTALFLGLLLVVIWPKGAERSKELLEKKYGQALGWGFLLLFFTPVVAIILLLSMVGVGAALMLMLFWLFAILAAKVLVMLAFGQYLLEKFAKKHVGNSYKVMFAGTLAAWVIFSIPGLGMLISFFATLWGLGVLVLILKKA